jgi:hypothetical protein
MESLVPYCCEALKGIQNTNPLAAKDVHPSALGCAWKLETNSKIKKQLAPFHPRRILRNDCLIQWRNGEIKIVIFLFFAPRSCQFFPIPPIMLS